MFRPAFASRSGELADWTLANLINRTDVWGSYLCYFDGSIGPITLPTKKLRGERNLSREDLVRHYEATGGSDIVGLHSGSPANTARWMAVDIDVHADIDASERMAGTVWAYVLSSYGYRPLLTGSNGKGGMHLRLVFDRPVPLADSYKFAKWLTRNYADWGLDPVETFPKQPSLAPPGQTGQYGNWLRLPGRHPKRDYWSDLYDQESGDWVVGDRAVEYVLKTTGSSPQALYDAVGDWKPEKTDKSAFQIPPVKRWYDHQGQTPYGKAALRKSEERVATAPESVRNITLNKTAYSLGKLVQAGHLDRQSVEEALWRAAESAGLGAGETKATIRSGIEAGIAEGYVGPVEAE